MAEPSRAAVSLRTDVVRIVLHAVRNQPGVAGALFSDIARFGFTIDSIAQTGAGDKHCDVTFTVPEHQSELVLEHLESRLIQYGAVSVIVDRDVALLTIEDTTIGRDPRQLGRVFGALAALDINILAISTGSGSVNCLIPRHLATAARAAVEPLL